MKSALQRPPYCVWRTTSAGGHRPTSPLERKWFFKKKNKWERGTHWCCTCSSCVCVCVSYFFSRAAHTSTKEAWNMQQVHLSLKPPGPDTRLFFSLQIIIKSFSGRLMSWLFIYFLSFKSNNCIYLVTKSTTDAFLFKTNSIQPSWVVQDQPIRWKRLDSLRLSSTRKKRKPNNWQTATAVDVTGLFFCVLLRRFDLARSMIRLSFLPQTFQ